MKLIFEIGNEGRHLSILPPCDVPETAIPEEQQRKADFHLPSVSENEISRHYSALARRAHGVNDGFYPLGSCTMKYNPRVDEEAAALPGFAKIHPLQEESTVQGSLQALHTMEEMLGEITGMDAFTLQPAAGAHGEFTGLLLIKAYHEKMGNTARTKIIIPDSAHGTNPASAVMAGFDVVSVPSNAEGGVDLEALRAAVGEDTAGLMLTNPNTVGIFDVNIREITDIIHGAGGLCYYDGANFNPILGRVRPGDMGFDVVHLNLHKTFGTPHGGGGPGSGPVGCKEFLAEFLPGQRTEKLEDGSLRWKKEENSIGAVKMFHGNFLVCVRALAYMLTLGAEGMAEASGNAVLNANYMREKLKDVYDIAYDGTCMHEFVMTLKCMHHETGVSALDIAKGLLDYGIHPPTMYFPLIVEEALMVEPTETEAKETLDEAVQALLELAAKAKEDPEWLHAAPHDTVIGRPDEVGAARHPVLRYQWEEV